mmetsp:Transcript_14530/g.34020  ORF Transcript_14530/g.34020 Transcript_14530/m.34020 type:complete len:208 (+) Transcript_14530:333-956(+)
MYMTTLKSPVLSRTSRHSSQLMPPLTDMKSVLVVSLRVPKRWLITVPHSSSSCRWDTTLSNWLMMPCMMHMPNTYITRTRSTIAGANASSEVTIDDIMMPSRLKKGIMWSTFRTRKTRAMRTRRKKGKFMPIFARMLDATLSTSEIDTMMQSKRFHLHSLPRINSSRSLAIRRASSSAKKAMKTVSASCHSHSSITVPKCSSLLLRL